MCGNCRLVHVPPQYHLDAEAEKTYYDLHENNVDDPGYRKFLSRMAEPLLEKIQPKSKGLDFGCGPAPLLAKMLEDHGHELALFDKFYFSNPSVLRTTYDFVVATEVIEHCYAADQVWKQWLGLLSAPALLAIMTKRVRSQSAFSTWHYIRDPTHVVFYSNETFEWVANKYKLSCEFVGADVVILRK